MTLIDKVFPSYPAVQLRLSATLAHEHIPVGHDVGGHQTKDVSNTDNSKSLTLAKPLEGKDPSGKKHVSMEERINSDGTRPGPKPTWSCAIEINAIRLPDKAIDTMAALHAGLHELAK